MKLSFWFLMLIAGLLASCSQEKKAGTKYFDFDSLIDDQVSQLTQKARVLDKEATLGVKSSDTTFLPSPEGWGKELEIFRQLEAINRPAYKSSYKIEDPLADSRSNLNIRQFTAGDVPVPMIRFYYQGQLTRLRKIEAEVQEANALYTTRRFLTLEFDEEESKPVLVRYSVIGFQKMPLGDTVRFTMLGRIEW